MTNQEKWQDYEDIDIDMDMDVEEAAEVVKDRSSRLKRHREMKRDKKKYYKRKEKKNQKDTKPYFCRAAENRFAPPTSFSKKDKLIEKAVNIAANMD